MLAPASRGCTSADLPQASDNASQTLGTRPQKAAAALVAGEKLRKAPAAPVLCNTCWGLLHSPQRLRTCCQAGTALTARQHVDPGVQGDYVLARWQPVNMVSDQPSSSFKLRQASSWLAIGKRPDLGMVKASGPVSARAAWDCYCY
jgi:hypothetical protein